MAKKFTPDNDKWGVKISIEKRRITRSSNVQRHVVIHNTMPSDLSNNKRKWYDDLKKFIADSKKEIDVQAHTLIESAKKWQFNANKKFDMIQQFIIEHNLQNEPVADEIVQEETPTVRPIEQTPRPIKQTPRPTKKVCFPSMPVIVTDSDDHDDLRKFLHEPAATLPTVIKIAKRRNTVCASSPNEESGSTDLPAQKISRSASSSKTAKSNGERKPEIDRLKSSSKSKEQMPVIANETSKCKGKTSMGSSQQPTSTTTQNDVYKKFLETQKIVLARQKEREEAARLNTQRDQSEMD